MHAVHRSAAGPVMSVYALIWKMNVPSAEFQARIPPSWRGSRI